MIVNEESIHASFVKKYNLGLIVNSEDDIYERIIDYKASFDYKIFINGCNDIIKIIKNDIRVFQNEIKIKLKKEI